MEFSARLFDAGTHRRADLHIGSEDVFGLFVGAGMTASKNHPLQFSLCKHIVCFIAYIRLSGIMGFRAVMPAPTNIPNDSAFLIREFLSFFFYHKHLDKLKFEDCPIPIIIH